tara:strand:- start:6794 stop:7930 length:1137 start_codon:yes stop_codon:yes gene_type:complete
MIKVWDYKDEYDSLRDEILSRIDTVFQTGTLVFGNQTEEFEWKFRQWNECSFGIGVGNCTDALYIALKALNIGEGDEVITVSNTAVPTCTAIAMTGAIPVFVDIDEYSLMDVTKIKPAITKNTRAILPVHLFGQCCDMDPIMELAEKHDLFVIEDCAQAHGARYKGKTAGSIGDIGCFSFYPTKIFGAYGDGGFITTQNKKLYQKMNRQRFFGMERKNMSSGHWNGKYYAIEHGPNTCNSRLHEIQAAILNVKLPHLHHWIDERKRIASIYDRELKDILDLPKQAPHNEHAYYIYVVAHPKRDYIMKELVKKDIHLNISYPWPVHIMDGYEYLGYKKGDFPVTEKRAEEIFSLPMYPALEFKDQMKVITSLKEIIEKI